MNLFLTSSKEVLRKCHIKYKNISEGKQNHIYKCDFVLCNKDIGEFSFKMHLNELQGDLIIYKDSEFILEKKWNKSIDSAIQYVCSYLAVKYFLFSHDNLTCRSDLSSLQSICNPTGVINLEHDSIDWITGNSFILELIKRPLFSRIINFVINTRGVYIKKWQIEAQKNYFNTSVNGGLPLTKKKDEVHEGTFMLHDIFHFLFLDPLITGNENENEKSLYIATRMMGEACTLVLADMISIEASDIGNKGYDTTKRKIHPVFKGTNLNHASLRDVKRMMYANSIYCLFGDLNVLYDICLDNQAVDEYDAKYKKFFSGDFNWNEKNIKSIFSNYDDTKEMRNYFQNTSFPDYHYTTKKLAENISINEGKYSFNRLFETLWSQFEQAIKSTNGYNRIESKRAVAQKYLSGQLFLRYKYTRELSKEFDLLDFDSLFKCGMGVILHTHSIEEMILRFNEISSHFLHFIQYLEDNEYILPHEAFVYRLHINHFEPEYVYYDHNDDAYEPLPDISSRLIGKCLMRTNEDLIVITPELQDLYSELIEYAK